MEADFTKKQYFTYTYYSPPEFKSLPLSVLDKAVAIDIIECPENLAEPIQFIADWINSFGTSFYEWWGLYHGELYNFRITFSYGSSESDPDLEVNLQIYFDAYAIVASPKQLPYSQYHLLATLVGPTDHVIEIIPAGLSDESYAYLRLGANKQFKIGRNHLTS